LGRGGYIALMFRGLPVRSKALLLAAILLVGGAATPLLDVLTFHRAATLPVPQLPGSGDRHPHGEDCALRLAIPHAPKAVPPTLAIPVADCYFRATLPLSALTPPASDSTLLPQPRAPPAHQA
jgi:hypothetical protein